MCIVHFTKNMKNVYFVICKFNGWKTWKLYMLHNSEDTHEHYIARLPMIMISVLKMDSLGLDV